MILVAQGVGNIVRKSGGGESGVVLVDFRGGEFYRAIGSNIIIDRVSPRGSLKVPGSFVEAEVIPFARSEFSKFDVAGVGSVEAHIPEETFNASGDCGGRVATMVVGAIGAGAGIVASIDGHIDAVCENNAVDDCSAAGAKVDGMGESHVRTNPGGGIVGDLNIGNLR